MTTRRSFLAAIAAALAAPKLPALPPLPKSPLLPAPPIPPNQLVTPRRFTVWDTATTTPGQALNETLFGGSIENQDIVITHIATALPAWVSYETLAAILDRPAPGDPDNEIWLEMQHGALTLIEAPIGHLARLNYSEAMPGETLTSMMERSEYAWNAPGSLTPRAWSAAVPYGFGLNPHKPDAEFMLRLRTAEPMKHTVPITVILQGVIR